jgi:hypothetical protein
MFFQPPRSFIDVVAIPGSFPVFSHRKHHDTLAHHSTHKYHRADGRIRARNWYGISAGREAPVSWVCPGRASIDRRTILGKADAAA